MRRTWLPLLSALAACAERTEPGAVTTSYHGVVRPLLEAHCTGCHQAGGVAPFALTDYSLARTYAAASAAAVAARRMPPWPADPACRHYEGERLLPAGGADLLARWLAEGTPEGDPASYVAPSTPAGLDPADELGPPTLSLGLAEPYVPSSERPDDYRCFPLDHEFTAESFVRRVHVVPGEPSVVHHVIVYLVQPEHRQDLERLDAASPGPGYTCFGGPGAGQAQNIGGWAPGGESRGFRDGAAMRVPAGARLVMQLHYNTSSAGPRPDRTRLELWVDTTRPEYLIQVRPLAHLAMEIPAGEAHSRQARLFRNTSGAAWTVAAVVPHMHLLGQRIRMTHLAADGGERCLVDIPRWDFGWQQPYVFREGELLQVAPGELVRLECWYDNTAAAQPVVNGVQQAPRDVTWGEGTLDEMCLGFLVLVEPYTPLTPPGEACPSFQGCHDQCIAAGRTPRTACLLQCSAFAGEGCTVCALTQAVQCTLDECPTSIGRMLECLESCQGQGDTAACVQSMCGGSILAYDQCAAPRMAAGACDLHGAACGVRF